MEGEDIIVAQRLKRLDSIIGKLKRFENMNLYRIQDLGGCRIICEDIDSLDGMIERLKYVKDFKLIRIMSYVDHPKESGYRGVHMIYEYCGKDSESYFKDIFIELQVRTKMQHAWATTVEILGLLYNSALKSSIDPGDGSVLKYLTCASKAFALKELGRPYDYSLMGQLRSLEDKLQIIEKLQGALTRMGSIIGLFIIGWGRICLNMVTIYWYFLRWENYRRVYFLCMV